MTALKYFEISSPILAAVTYLTELEKAVKNMFKHHQQWQEIKQHKEHKRSWSFSTVSAVGETSGFLLDFEKFAKLSIHECRAE